MDHIEELENELKFLLNNADKINYRIKGIKAILGSIPVWLSSDHQHGSTIEPDEKIGFHNISKLRKVLTALYAGKKLLLEHSGVGNHYIFMNPQHNRISVECINTTDGHKCSCLVNENNILCYMSNYPANWYIVDDNYIL